jgi:hypothetical protein
MTNVEKKGIYMVTTIINRSLIDNKVIVNTSRSNESSTFKQKVNIHHINSFSLTVKALITNRALIYLICASHYLL